MKTASCRIWYIVWHHVYKYTHKNLHNSICMYEYKSKLATVQTGEKGVMGTSERSKLSVDREIIGKD